MHVYLTLTQLTSAVVIVARSYYYCSLISTIKKRLVAWKLIFYIMCMNGKYSISKYTHDTSLFSINHQYTRHIRT